MNDFKLDNHPKIKSGFTVPDNYFENFKLKMNPKPEPKVIPIFARKKVWIPAVAAVLILALMLPIYNYRASLQQPDANSIENYLTYNSGISQYELVALLEQEDIDKIDIDFQLEDKAIEDILTINNNFENYIID